MSLQAVSEMRRLMWQRQQAMPTEIRIGRAVLDACADETHWFLPPRTGHTMTPIQWREHVANMARKGELYLFGMRVLLCDGEKPRMRFNHVTGSWRASS